MAASFFINAMQVDFESVLSMEHTGIAKLFKSLEDTGLMGFLEASSSVYEAVVVEFFANAKFIAGTISIKYCGRNADEVLGTDAPFRAPNKKKEMKIEYCMLHDIVAKALCAKSGSFDMVTSKKFDPNGSHQCWFESQLCTSCVSDFGGDGEHANQAVTMSCGANECYAAKSGKNRPWRVGEVAPQKVLNTNWFTPKSGKTLKVGPAGETSRISGATASEKQSTADSPQSLPRKPENEMNKPEKATVEKPKKKEKVVQMVKKNKLVVQQPVEARIQVAPVKSTSATSSDEDSCPLAKLKRGGSKVKLVVDSSDSESTVSVPSVLITKKHRTKRTKKVKPLLTRMHLNLVPFRISQSGLTRLHRWWTRSHYGDYSISGETG
ncbi:hypothetical protein F511_33900 [Dorcoceras hygrometricum]|uniref:Uncharacterized protein n=1 Tax=Dorcoceras hygrometricum TaxID=472368 RepID=A0A2Z7AN40_9LAMI|nr:hypothetical protein F511_33900 [Dorcoceras hygrometricum]